MLKRVTILCLTAVLLLGLLLPMATETHAAYENTHVNTGNQRADIIAIAATQLGYAEEAGGWTKYGDYHGNAYADWCGYFVSWCARQAGVSTSVLKKQGWAAASKWGLPTFTASERLPQPGDLYFRGTAHVGFVYYTSGNKFYTLEGNSVGDKVVCRALDLYSSSYTFASPNYAGSNNAAHVHDLVYTHESAHPHKEYKKCSGCDYVTYTGANQIVNDCVTCIQENCSHEYGAWTSVSSSQHTRTCPTCNKTETADHGWTDIKIVKEATCAETGSKNQYCSVCDTERTVTLDKTNNHKYSVWKSAGENGHSHECAVCKKVETVPHNWQDVKVTKEPTCKETGTKDQKCSTCGEEREATIEKTDDHQYGQWSYTDTQYHSRTCETCGIRNNGEHKVDEENWETDGENHWHQCVDCKEKYDVEAHTFSGDCVSPCDVCEYLSPDGHNYGTKWYSNEKVHWQVCKDCGETTLEKKHVFDGECDADCNDCGYERNAGHQFMDVLLTDAVGHWQQCDVCGHMENYEKHIPGPEATEETAQVCTVCNYEIVPVLEHVHVYTYTGSEDTHVGVCACGHKLAEEVHSWNMTTGRCDQCGASGVQQTSSQSWDFVWLIMAGAVVTTAVVTTVVMVRSGKKRKAEMM